MFQKFIAVPARRKKESESACGATATVDKQFYDTCDLASVRAKYIFSKWQKRGSPRSLIKLAGEVFAQSNLLTIRSAVLKAEPTEARRQRAEETLATLLPLTEKLERELARSAG